MPWSTSNRIVENAAQFIFSPPLGKSLNTIENFEGLSLVDTTFAPRDSPKPLKKNCPCYPVTLFLPLTLVMGVSMIPNINSFTRYYERLSWRRDFYSLLEALCIEIERELKRRGQRGTGDAERRNRATYVHPSDRP